jgi:hypothetical protein
MTRSVALTIRVRIGDAHGAVVTVRGREAWALRMLMAAGERGCTPIDHPGPRWSGYVHDLRKFGIAIETERERHGGPFAGDHARYVLRSPVYVLDPAQHTAAASPSNPSVVVRRTRQGFGPGHREKLTRDPL